jgi:cytochrome P450 family 2 subfamily J
MVSLMPTSLLTILDKNLVATVGDLFEAGSETTSTTLSWAILYLTSHPTIQEKMQEEIDRVVGSMRLPSLTDRPQ